MSRRNHLLALTLGMVAGCTLLTPVAGLVGDDADASAIGDGASPETGDDAVATDGGPVDETSDGPVAPPTRCPERPGALFCDDFDDLDAAIVAKWTPFTTADASLTESSAARSAPRALRTVTPGVSSGYAQANVTRSLVAPPTKKISVRFAMHAVQPGVGASGYNSFVSVVFEDAACATRVGGSRERRLALVFTANGIHLAVIGFAADCVDAGEDFNSIAVTQPLPVDKWYAMEIVAERASCPNQSGSSVRVLIDENEFVCVPLVIDPTTKTKGLALRLGSGIGAVWEATTLDFDDVEVIAEP